MAAMSSRSTIALLVLGGLAAAVAVDIVREKPAAVGVPIAERGASARSGERESPMDLAAALRRERFASELAGDPFAGREVQRSPAAVTAPPPGPPPFAYRYGGQFRIDTGGWRVYLLKGNDLVAIHVGDVLEGSYKVMAIGAEEFEVVHLPSSTKRVLQYSSLGTGSALAQGDHAPLAPQEGAARSGVAAAQAAFSGPGPAAEGRVAATSSATGSGALVGVPMTSGVGTSPRATSSSTSVTGGAVPSGTLGASAPAASAPRLGVAPPASGSMPMSPAPAGTMQTLPAPTGRLGV
jgi:hypothetical protein